MNWNPFLKKSGDRPIKVKVTFVDAANGHILGETEIDADAVPDTFNEATTLELGGSPWKVVRAVPAFAKQFRRSGALQLEIIPVTTMNPANILFTLPTLCASIPVTTGTGAPGLRIAEDDWRQVEFISSRWDGEIDTMLREIRGIYSEHSSASGFDSVYVREEIAAPLQGISLPLSDLAKDGFMIRHDLGYETGLIIRDSFIASKGGTKLYGLSVSGSAEVLGIVPARQTTDRETAAVLTRLALSKSLVLVDWCQCLRLTPDLVSDYLLSESRINVDRLR